MELTKELIAEYNETTCAINTRVKVITDTLLATDAYASLSRWYLDGDTVAYVVDINCRGNYDTETRYFPIDLLFVPDPQLDTAIDNFMAKERKEAEAKYKAEQDKKDAQKQKKEYRQLLELEAKYRGHNI